MENIITINGHESIESFQLRWMTEPIGHTQRIIRWESCHATNKAEKWELQYVFYYDKRLRNKSYEQCSKNALSFSYPDMSSVSYYKRSN